MKRFLLLVTFLVLALPLRALAYTPITFNFDTFPGTEINPTITVGGLTITFSTDNTVNPDKLGVAHWSDEWPELYGYSGPGYMCISKQTINPPDQLAIFLDFSAGVYWFGVYAFQGNELRTFPVTVPFTFEVYGAGGVLLGLVSTDPRPLNTPFAYEYLTFMSATPIVRLRLLGLTNTSYFDELKVVTDQSILAVEESTWGSIKALYR